MSTKARYKLTIIVSTMEGLVRNNEKIHVDTCVYALQVVQTHTQFTQINKTLFGKSCTGSFSDSTSDFILFGVDAEANEDTLRILTYNCVSSLIGTVGPHYSMCINIPKIRNINTGVEFDMYPFILGVVRGVKDAMKNCTSVLKMCPHTLYFTVPEDIREPFSTAMESIE